MAKVAMWYGTRRELMFPYDLKIVFDRYVERGDVSEATRLPVMCGDYSVQGIGKQLSSSGEVPIKLQGNMSCSQQILVVYMFIGESGRKGMFVKT
jgi:hypothetical protein